MSNTALKRTTLYFTEGASDKIYDAEIIPVDGGHVVNFRYGRRGQALQHGSKTQAPVDFQSADKIFEKLIKEKKSKGYTECESGESYSGTECAGIKTDFVPQLLNPITEEEALRLIEDDDWFAQEKMDGERRAGHADVDTIATGMNRKGLAVPIPQGIANELNDIARRDGGAVRVDAEIVNDILYVFDLHVVKGNSIRKVGCLERMMLATQTINQYKSIKAVPVAVTTEEKRALWNKVKARKGEGVVFKLRNCTVMEGRPNSWGSWVKFKFVERASCIVSAINSGKRSVALKLIDAEGAFVEVGNVTIPPNYTVPALGSICDCDYLYAYRNGSLYQPIYRGNRSDIDPSACTVSQLKYKPEGRKDEDDDTPE